MRWVTPAVSVVAIFLMAGCGGSDPPDRATSEQQIRQTVVNFNRLAFAGHGDAACELATDRSYPHLENDIVPKDKRNCVDFWNWFGPVEPQVRAMVAGDRVEATVINGTGAIARMSSGAHTPLVWQDGRWKVDLHEPGS